MKEYFLVAIADRDEAVKALRVRRQLLDVQITVAGQATDEYLEWLDVRPGEIFCVMAVSWVLGWFLSAFGFFFSLFPF
jgi:hypothetical protein